MSAPDEKQSVLLPSLMRQVQQPVA